MKAFMIPCEKLFHRIDELRDEYLQFWIDICSIESPTTYKQGVDAVGRYFTEKAKARGWKVESHHEDVSGDPLCITMNPDASGQPIAVSGHMDTVHDVGSFGTPPVHVDKTYLYGPGAKDCKGGTVGGFLAMAALEDCGFRDRPIKLILQSDEENSSATSQKHTVEYMAEKAKDCLVFLNTEGYKPDTVTLRRKGILKYRFTVFGKDTHASRCDEGASAIAEAAHKILLLEQYKDRSTLTCSVGVIHGGTKVNVVPKECTFEADFRFATAEQYRQVEEMIRTVSETSTVPGTTCRTERMSMRPAMEENETNWALLRRFNELCVKNGLPELKDRTNPGGSDASDMVQHGIPTLDSLGVEGDGTHSLTEKAEIASLARCAKRLAVAMAYL